MSNPLNQYNPMQSALALLQPTVSYAQKRADADRNLMYQMGMTQMAQQDAELARQQAQLLQQQQAQLASVPFLEQDQRRFQLELDTFKQKIRTRIENDFGGDHEAYARSGMLDQDMQNLALDAQRSPLYSAALQRRTNFLQAQKDAQDGKIYRSVQYRLKDGKVKTAPWEQAYQDFADDNTEELPYNGGFKVDGKWQKMITDAYSPRVGQLGKFKPDRATLDEMATALVAGEGLTVTDAQEYLRRSAPLLGNLFYKHDPRDPYREEQLRLGWANYGLGKERNRLTAERNQTLKKAAGQGAISDWDITFTVPNMVTKNKQGNPSALPVTVFDGEMKPMAPQQAGFSSLMGFDGSLLRDKLLTMLPGVRASKDKTNGQTTYQTNSLGKVYVTVPNQAGGLDLRQSDLSGLNVKVMRVGNVFVDDSAPSELERATGKKNRVKVEAVIRLSSDEAKKAQSGKLFGAAVPWAASSKGGLLGNVDTPTGKGAAVFVGEEEDANGNKQKYYDVPVLIDYQMKAANYQQLNQRNPIFSKSGQIGANETMDGGGVGFYDTENDDLNYY